MISQTTLRSLRTAKSHELLLSLGDPPGDLTTAKLIKALQRALDEGIRIGLDAALEIHKEQKLGGGEAMRRIQAKKMGPTTGAVTIKGKPNVRIMLERDYRLMRAVVRAAEAVNKLCRPRDWNALSRAVAALNAPGKGRHK